MTDDQLHPADAVFEGGGVKSIALLGALSVMEQTWRWENLAGTSGGAIVAAFAATGMRAGEIRDVLDKIDLREILDTGWEDRVADSIARLLRRDRRISLVTLLPYLGSVLRDYGIFEGDRFKGLVEEHLPHGIRTFGDLIYDGTLDKDSPYRYKLRVVASDITARRMLILPQDIRHFGRDPDTLEISEALRMSMSIPILFEPATLTDGRGRTHHIVDGGLLSNFPLWMFDAPAGQTPEWPTFGFDLHSPIDEADGPVPFPQDVDEIDGFIEFVKALFYTMSSAIDRRYIAKRHWARTIPIDDRGIPTAKFDLTEEEKDSLWDSGVQAATEFMATKWAGGPQAGFTRWTAEYRRQVEAAQEEYVARHGGEPSAIGPGPGSPPAAGSRGDA